MTGKSEYAQAGVDYTQIEPFKRAMVAVGRRTLEFPRRRGVVVESLDHGGSFRYAGPLRDVEWVSTTEGLGNKNWIAEWMAQHAGTGRSYYEGIGIDTALMAANDVIAHGAMPVVYTDEVAAGDSEWFQNEQRAAVLAESFFQACELCGMAMPAGESPSLKYLIKAEPPVTSAPSLSGCVTGIVTGSNGRITGAKLRAGDLILGAESSGLHANGVSLVIKRALTLPDQFLTRLPNGDTLGEEALIPTRSYVRLIEALLEAGIDIHALVPGTGGGISKIAFHKHSFTYRVDDWPIPIPLLFQFMRELGVSLEDCLTTFNWGIGYYVFVHPDHANQAIQVAACAGYSLHRLGVVEEGKRQVVFHPEGMTLQPPGE